MSNQPRVAKVLAALLVSMTAGAIVLMVLGSNPPSGGPFSLSTYYRLNSVDRVMRSRECQAPNRWNSIEIYFSGTKRGNLQQPAGAGESGEALSIKANLGQYQPAVDAALASGPDRHLVQIDHFRRLGTAGDRDGARARLLPAHR